MKSKVFFGLSVTLLVLWFCVAWGSVSISFNDSLAIFLERMGLGTFQGDSHLKTILLDIRLPRVLTTFLMGIALSISGMTMQSLLKNPLADGSTLGVSSGASLGAVIAILLGWHLPWQGISPTFIFAIVFAFLSLVLILALAHRLDPSLNHMTLILTGIIFSMFISSVLNLMIVFSGDKLRTIFFWTMGSLVATTYQDVVVLLLAILIGGGIIWVNLQELNAFAMGDQMASHLGVNIRAKRLHLFLATSLLIGISVAVAGSIPFVGLIIPHMSRMVFGANHKRLFPGVVLLGGNFLVVADLLARTIASPLEIPIGVITSFIGTLTFIFLLMRKRGGWS